MKKILALSLVALLVFASALCAFSASAAKGDNLASGKTLDYQPHKNSDGTLDGYNTDLTDGKTADTFNWADGSWFAFQIHNNTDEAGYGILTVDLGQAEAIGQVRVHTLFANGSNGGVGNPRSVVLELSADNVGWQMLEIKEYEPSTVSDWDPQWIEFSVDNIDARYVRLTFEQTQAFVMIDEVEVLEGEKTAAPEEPSSEQPAESSEEPSEEPSDEPSEAASSEAPSAVTSEETSTPSDTVSEETTASSEAVTGAASSAALSSDAADSDASGGDSSNGNGLLIGIVIAVVAAIAVAAAAVIFLRKRKE